MKDHLLDFARDETGASVMELGVILGMFGIIAIGWLPRLLLR